MTLIVYGLRSFFDSVLDDESVIDGVYVYENTGSNVLPLPSVIVYTHVPQVILAPVVE